MTSKPIEFQEIQPKLHDETLTAIQELGFRFMTPVQATTIPLFLQNKDVCVEATTGSGKTLSFIIPVFEMLIKVSPSLQKYDIGALILAPTRELALQIRQVFSIFGKFHSSLTCQLFVGGHNSIQEDIQTFSRDGGNIIVGTPGRVLDLINRMGKVSNTHSDIKLSFKRLEVLVLDEADKLLDMGFQDTINQILQMLPKQRRTGLFSATQTKEVSELARAGLRNPVNVTVKVQMKDTGLTTEGKLSTSQGMSSSVPSTLENYYLMCEYEERPYQLLHFILNHPQEKIIIFCATCACVDYYAAAFQQLFRFMYSSKESKPKATSSSSDPMEKYLSSEVISVFRATSSSSSVPSSAPLVVPFHGKMVQKKRSGYLQRFKSNTTGGVMFSTDVAARGLDIPDVDWIIQMAAPKDPSFFVHRIGRTARAGRRGGAILYITPEEEPYIELLRGRGVPLTDLKEAKSSPLYQRLYQTADPAFQPKDVIEVMKSIAKTDREILESGSTAYISFIRAYKENLCSYIFRLEQLDLGGVGRAYGLLRLPKIAETRGVKGRPIVFDTDPIDTSSIPYRHPEKEKARLQRLVVMKEQKENEREEKKKATQKEWIPQEEFVRTEKKRERKRKQSTYAKIKDEWDELAAEEAIYRKFKKGKISKAEYDESLFNDNVKDLQMKKKHDVENSSGEDNFDDSDDDASN